MDSAVAWLMSILLTMNKYPLQSLLLRFVLHMPNIIYLNLNYIIIDQLKLLTIFLSVLCKIQANQSNLLIYVQLLLWKQEIPWLFDVERNVSIEKKKTEDGENLSLKALPNRFCLTLKSCSWFDKVVHGQPSIK